MQRPNLYLNIFSVLFMLNISAFAQWDFMQQIEIQPTGEELTNFAVMITLDQSRIQYDQTAEDGSDLRFTSDSTDNPHNGLNFWIENWNISGESKVWVKIPAISGSNSTNIYMHYGNDAAINKSNGSSTFLFFDDFLGNEIDGSIWTEFGPGSVTVQDSYVRFVQGTQDYDKGIYTDTLDNFSTYKIRSHYRLLDTDSRYHIQHRISSDLGIYHLKSGNTTIFDVEDDRIAVGHINDSGSHSSDSSTAFELDTVKWYTGEAWYSGSAIYCVMDEKAIRSSVNIYNNQNLAICVFSRNNTTPRVDVDWIFIRDFASKEPDLVFGKLTSLASEKTRNGVINDYALKQNYPNPFNPITTIIYQLPITNYVDLSIYNLLGQKVETLVSNIQAAGTYKVQWDVHDMAGGVYFYRISTNEGFTKTKKLILLK